MHYKHKVLEAEALCTAEQLDEFAADGYLLIQIVPVHILKDSSTPIRGQFLETKYIYYFRKEKIESKTYD